MYFFLLKAKWNVSRIYFIRRFPIYGIKTRNDCVASCCYFFFIRFLFSVLPSPPSLSRHSSRKYVFCVADEKKLNFRRWFDISYQSGDGRTQKRRTVALLCFDLILIFIKWNECFACEREGENDYHNVSCIFSSKKEQEEECVCVPPVEWQSSYYIFKNSIVYRHTDEPSVGKCEYWSEIEKKNIQKEFFS